MWELQDHLLEDGMLVEEEVPIRVVVMVTVEDLVDHMLVVVMVVQILLILSHLKVEQPTLEVAVEEVMVLELPEVLVSL